LSVIMAGMATALKAIARVAKPLLRGPGFTFGAIAAGAGWALGGAGVAIPAFAVAAATARACIRHRTMTPWEQSFAREVFGCSLPGGERIVLTDLAGLGGGCFVCPALNGQILVNLGPRCFKEPMAYCCPAYEHPGKLFVHELAHAWQLVHGHYYPRLWQRVVAGPRAGDDFYRPPARLAPPWPVLNLEQQATVVDEWYAPGHLGPPDWAGTTGMSHEHPYWPYIRDVVRSTAVRA
jgi:hypothetical protein